ncbi:MAG: hypothetical protein IJ662_06490 [Clostridia bacterium]|nr:hypothetical protein [Clostridia bacterium]
MNEGDADNMTENGTRAPELPEKRRCYSPRETADIRSEAITAMLNSQLELSRKATERTDLHDLAAVQTTVERYVAACAGASVLPNIEGMAASLGVSRRRIYQIWDERPDDPVALYLDRKRLEWASARIALAERGMLDSTMSIFITLNSGLGYSNRHDVTVEMPLQNPLERFSHDDEELARKYIAGAVKTEDGMNE